VPHTVKTANATVPMIKPSELLNLSMKGGFEPCCVNDDSHFGRAIVYGDYAARKPRQGAPDPLRVETGWAEAKDCGTPIEACEWA
jgi:hypothetical protein